MDEDLYDEFGNYIGPALEDEEDTSAQLKNAWDQYGVEGSPDQESEMNDTFVQYDASRTYQVVLPDEKQIYPDAEEQYPNVEILIQDKDSQTLSEAIVIPKSKPSHIYVETEAPVVTYSEKMVAALLDHPSFHRLISISGGWHHGKSSFLDMFIQQTHVKEEWSRGVHTSPYMDSLKSEQERETTLSTKPITQILPNQQGKSHIFTLLDTPGHIDFVSDVVCASRAADSAIIVVDVIEGITKTVEAALIEALAAKQQLVLCLNKMDRLIVEARMPPRDAYRKLVLLIEQFNAVIVTNYTGVEHPPFVSPLNSTVMFASSLHQWVFTLSSFAEIYQSKSKKFNTATFAKKLWGNVYMQEDRTFSPSAPSKGAKNTFLQFIWEPICKLYSSVFGMEDENILQFCDKYNISLTSAEVALPSNKLLPLISSRFFPQASVVFAETMLQVTSSPLTGNGIKSLAYTAPTNTKEFKSVVLCDAKGPLVVQTLGHYPTEDTRTWTTLVRVMSGTLELDTPLRFYGADYHNNPENTFISTISSIQLMQANRYMIPLSRAPAGSIVLVNGLESSTGIFTGMNATSTFSGGFLGLRNPNPAHFRIAIEPLIPTHLSKQLHALKLVRCFYSALRIHTEESGEIVLSGTGELYLDVVQHDIRVIYGDVEVRVSDPYISLCETIQERSELLCSAKTNFEGTKKSTITTLAEPLESYIMEDIALGQYDHIDGFSDRKMLGTLFHDKYQWDILESRNIWTFGGKECPNVLVNDSLRNRSKHEDSREACVDGFLWAMREGPLLQEPIRGVKMRITDLQLTEEALYKTRKHLVPIARKSMYASMLMARPRLMEPLQLFEILCKEINMEIVNKVLASRRGYITEKRNVPGTPFILIQGHVPLLEICGMDTDLRINTRGQAQLQTYFHKWEIVPGDPMDKEATVKPLVAAPNYMLARDLLLKIRRRKGLSEDVDVTRYFDEDMLLELAAHMAQDE